MPTIRVRFMFVQPTLVPTVFSVDTMESGWPCAAVTKLGF